MKIPIGFALKEVNGKWGLWINNKWGDPCYGQPALVRENKGDLIYRLVQLFGRVPFTVVGDN